MEGKRKPENSGREAKPSKGTSIIFNQETFLVCSVCVSGKTPSNGNLLTLACCVLLPDHKRILATFSRNVLPLSNSHGAGHPDVIGFLQTKMYHLNYFYDSPESPLKVFQDLNQFCKPFSKLTLVGSPLFSIYPWITHYWYELLSSKPMPWGFSGLCARSLASGVLGCSMKDLPKNKLYSAFADRSELTGIPANDCIVHAIVLSNLTIFRATMDSTKEMSSNTYQLHNSDHPTTQSDDLNPVLPLRVLQEHPVEWACPKPHLLGVLPGLSPSIVLGEGEASNLRRLPFFPYPSITDVDVEAPAETTSLLDLLPEDIRTGEWVASEKVHGANFAIVTDGTALRGAKRSGYLSSAQDGKAFYYFDRLLMELESSVFQVFHTVKKSAESISPSTRVVAICVCGELCGGWYPHPLVPVDLRGTKVQNGVWYSPRNEFYAFDVAALHVPVSAQLPNVVSSGEWRFIPFLHALSVLETAGLHGATILKRGSLQEMMSLNPEFTTLLPSALGLPPLKDNFAEGYVIRPVHDSFVQSHSMRTRVIIKKKHPKFQEFSSKGPKESLREFCLRLAASENRYISVCSKYTNVECDLDGFIVAAVVEDILNDALQGVSRSEVDATAIRELESVVANNWALVHRGSKIPQ